MEKLKFLAELASESENEGALEIIRCQSLTMVGTSYGPLIYELNPKANFEELLNMVKLLSANLKKNPKLAEKIVSPLSTCVACESGRINAKPRALF